MTRGTVKGVDPTECLLRNGMGKADINKLKQMS